MKFLKRFKWEILIFLLVVTVRIPDLGHDMFNTDVWKWKSRTYDFSTGVFTLDFEKTIQKYHPGVSLMWIGSAGVKIFNLYHEFTTGAPPADNAIETVFALHTAQKVLVVLVIGLLLSLTFYPLKKMFGERYAWLAVGLVAVEPFYVALTRVMHLEGLMSSFMIASFVWFVYHLRERTNKRLLLSAVLASGAFLTKTSSIFLIPLFGLILMFESIKDSQKTKAVLVTNLKVFFKWLGLAVLFFVLLWPAMITHAPLALKTMYRGIFTIGIERDHPQLFLGRWVDDPGIMFYPIVFAFRSSWWLLAGLVGFAASKKKMEMDDQKKRFVVYSMLFVIFYIIELTIPSKKLDRYILPSLITSLFVASFFYEYVLDTLQQKFKYAKEVFVALLIAPILVTLLNLHPYYLSYYSPLFGGLKRGIYAIEPKWMIGQHEAVDYFEGVLEGGEFERYSPEESLDSQLNKASIEKKLTIGFKEKYYTQIWPFIEEIGARATIKDITIHAQNSNYFVYPVYDDDSYLEDRVKIEYVDTIKLRGVDLYNIYKKAN